MYHERGLLCVRGRSQLFLAAQSLLIRPQFAHTGPGSNRSRLAYDACDSTAWTRLLRLAGRRQEHHFILCKAASTGRGEGERDNAVKIVKRRAHPQNQNGGKRITATRIEAALIDTGTRGKLLIGQLTPKRLTMDELIPQLDLSEFFLGWCSQL